MKLIYYRHQKYYCRDVQKSANGIKGLVYKEKTCEQRKWCQSTLEKFTEAYHNGKRVTKVPSPANFLQRQN